MIASADSEPPALFSERQWRIAELRGLEHLLQLLHRRARVAAETSAPIVQPAKALGATEMISVLEHPETGS